MRLINLCTPKNFSCTISHLDQRVVEKFDLMVAAIQNLSDHQRISHLSFCQHTLPAGHTTCKPLLSICVTTCENSLFHRYQSGSPLGQPMAIRNTHAVSSRLGAGIISNSRWQPTSVPSYVCESALQREARKRNQLNLLPNILPFNQYETLSRGLARVYMLERAVAVSLLQLVLAITT